MGIDNYTFKATGSSTKWRKEYGSSDGDLPSDIMKLAYVAIDPIEGDYIPLSEAYKIDEHGNEIKAEIVGNTHQTDVNILYESEGL